MRLRLPSEPSADLRKIVSEYFDSNAFLRKDNLRRFEQVLEKLRTVDETAVVYSDVLDFIDRENELTSGLEDERRYLAQLKKGKRPLEGLLKVQLFPYQIRGALFAACRGRVILADDMGLGKTIQAIAGAELLVPGKPVNGTATDVRCRCGGLLSAPRKSQLRRGCRRRVLQ